MFGLPKKQILLIEDNPRDTMLFQEFLADNKQYNYNFKLCKTVRSGLHYYINMDIDCAILDYRLDDGDGLSLLNELRLREIIKAPIIFMTAFANEKLKSDAIAAGAYLFLDKNRLDKSIMNKAVSSALGKYETQKLYAVN